MASMPLSLEPIQRGPAPSMPQPAAQPAPAARAAAGASSWPAPPGLAWGADASIVAEAGRAILADGELEGEVASVDFTRREVRMRVAGADHVVPFETLRELSMPRPMELTTSGRGCALMPPSQSYRWEAEGVVREGDTLGVVRDGAGVFLYPPLGAGRVTRIFVPAQRAGAVEVKNRPHKALALEPIEWVEPPRSAPAAPARVRNAADLAAALAAMALRPIRRLGEALLDGGTVSAEQLGAALAMQKKHPRKLLGEILIEQGAVRADQLRLVLTQKLGIPSVELGEFAVDPAARALVPQSLCMRHKFMPLQMDGDALVVAMDNPLSSDAMEALRFATGRRIVPVLASWVELRTAITARSADLWNPGAAIAPADSLPVAKTMPDTDAIEFVGVDELTSRLRSEIPVHAEEEGDVEVRESDSTLVRLVNRIITDAFESGASDIHIEPSPGKRSTRIRVRRDGALQDYTEVPARFRAALVSRLKIMANLNIAERRKPQDGKIDFSKFGGAKLELRVATIPTNNGIENVILRLLAAAKPRRLDEIGLEAHVLGRLKALAERPHGLLLVCGPTGSGKTTTLHSLIHQINTAERKIWTAEDPVEITQEGLCQVQVNPKIDWTFAAALRSFLRADPDVIMVGEMRDGETAQIAVEASLTGHLVMSTLHTNSAPETVTRLLDLGADPFNFGDTLLGVLSQRLVRRVCPDCARHAPATREQLEALAREYAAPLGQDPAPVLEKWLARRPAPRLATAAGCTACGGSGHRGRLGLYEFMEATPSLRSLIQSRAPTERIRACAVAEGMRTLRQDGIEKVLEGVTTLEQVRAACP